MQRTGTGAAEGAAPAAGAPACSGSPIRIPSSRAQARSVAASGTTVAVPAAAPANTSPVPPSIVIVSPCGQRPVADGHAPLAEDHPGRADDGRDPPAARDDGGVAGEPAGGGQDPRRPGHAVDVVGRGLGADQDDGPAGLGGLDRGLGRRHDLAAGHTGRRREPGREDRAGVAALGHHRRRVRQDRRDAADRLRAVEAKPGSSAMSTAIRRAAWGLRLPTRHWSIQSRPCSMVNSMSHRSR